MRCNRNNCLWMTAGFVLIMAGVWIVTDTGKDIAVHPVESDDLQEKQKADAPDAGSGLSGAAPDNQKSIEAAVQGLFSNRESRNPYRAWRVQELIDALEAGQYDRKECGRMLWALCSSDDPAALDFLSSYVADETADEYLRSSVLDGLAASGSRRGYELTLDALQSESEVVARGAVRALGRYGDEESVEILTGLAFDYIHDPAVAMTAAEALGEAGSPEAADTLVQLFEQGVLEGNNDVLEFALSGLGKINSEEAGQYLQEVYELVTDPELRILVLEGLEGAEGDATAILSLAMADENEEVRAAAAWDLACAEETSLTADDLMAYLDGETDAGVRRNLYLALDNQDELDADHLMAIVGQEPDPSARLAGYQVMTRQLNEIPDESYAAFSGRLREDLISLKNGGQLNPRQEGMVDQMIKRIEMRPSQY